jgi:hypothetical protein
MKTTQTLTLQLWDRSPSLVSQLIPFCDQHWTQTTHHGVGTELDFPCATFKGDLCRTWDTECVSGHEWEDQWIYVPVPDQTSLYLQESSFRCSWWSLGDALWSLVGPWESSAASDSPSVVTGCTGCTMFERSGWSRLELLKLIVRVQTMQTLPSQIHHILKKSQVLTVAANEQPERWGHNHVLLCNKKNRWTSVRAQR